MREKTIQKFKDRDAVVGVVGLGYVGLPLVIRCAQAGFRVVGFDIDQTKIEALLSGESYIEHITTERISELIAVGASFTTDFSLAESCDAIIVCVPTPLNKYREPDLGYVTGTIEALLPHLRPGQLLSLESTTYPGTTEEELSPRVESIGVQVGENFYLVYSPEREDPGNLAFDTKSIPKLVGGLTENCKKVGVALYEELVDQVVPVSSTRVAEMTKLLENIYRAVNIGLVNEMKLVADRMGIDIFEVVEAASTKPFGFTPYYPGPGLGGHCIPIDPFFLTWKAREFGLHTRFIELAGEVNRSMPDFVISKLIDAMNDRRKPLYGAKILVLGVAYKKNVDDMRESPSLELMEILSKKGAIVSYSDPHVPQFPAMRKHKFDLRSVLLNEANLREYDAVILATDHDSFDYDLIAEFSSLVVDTRGRYRNKRANIVRA